MAEGFTVFLSRKADSLNSDKVNNNLFSYRDFFSFANGQLFAVSCLEIVENTNSSQALSGRAETSTKKS